MSYNIAESATLTEFTSGITLAQDTLVAYTPDYRTVTAAANVTVVFVTVDAGGLLTAKTGGAEVYDATAQSGGVIDVASIDTFRLTALDGGVIKANGADLNNLVVESGGSALAAGNYVAFENISIKEGGTFSTPYAIYNINGSETNIASGTWVQEPDAFAIDGVLYNYVQSDGTRNFRRGLGLSNTTLTGGTMNISSGCTARDLYVSGGTLNISANTAVNNLVYTGGTVTIGASVAIDGITVAGTGNITLTGLDVYNAKVNSGGTINANGSLLVDPVVEAGGTLKINAWTEVRNLQYTGGTVTIGATNVTIKGFAVTGTGDVTFTNIDVYDASAADGGIIRITGCDMYDLVVGSGGSAVTTGNYVWFGDMNIQAGGTFSTPYAIYSIAGTGTNIASGTWVQEPDAYAVDGVLYNYVQSDGTRNFKRELALSNTTLTGGTMNISSGCSARDLYVSGGTLNISANTAVNNLVYTGGTVAIGANVAVDGITVAGTGNITLTGLDVYNAKATSGGVINANGSLLVNPVVEAGGALTLNAYTEVRDLLFTGGTVTIGATNVRISGFTVRDEGDIAFNSLDVYNASAAAGGVIRANGSDMYTMVIESGGSAVTTGNYVAFINADIREGGTFSTPYDILTIKGAETRIASGTWIEAPDAYAVDGVIYDYIQSGGTRNFKDGIGLSDATLTGGTMNISSGVTAQEVTVTGGTLNISSGGVLDGVTQSAGLVRLGFGAALSNADVKGGDVYLFDYPEATGVERAAMTAENVNVSGGRFFLRGTNVSGDSLDMYGGIMYVQNGAVAEGVGIYGGEVRVYNQPNPACVDYDKDGATVRDVTAFDGGKLQIESGGIVESGTIASGGKLIIYKGGQAGLTSAAAGAEIDLSFWDVTSGGPGNTEALISEWGDFSANAKVNVYSLEAGYDYKIADASNANVTLDCGSYLIYNSKVRTGGQYSNAFSGCNYDFTDGMTLSVSEFTVDTEDTAATLSATTATALADGGLAAKWNADTTYAAGVTLAGAGTAGNVWVEIDGTDITSAPLYGAAGDYGYTVNLYAKSGAIKNLAAGAEDGGRVTGVRLTLAGADVSGAAYAGGFGSVTDETETLITAGEFAKDFYAGALAKRNASASSVGDVTLTVTGGTFAGNIYGASAVKTAAAVGTGVRHSAGDVTLTLAGGEAENAKFCAFAGGYATGDATGTVYTVDSVTATISGGDWGEAAGGRGVFGGIMASGVEAQVIGDVNITISGDATMGNVYGGGWAQKNGTSTVGDVNISIAGGTVANVFGGGSHSTSGGATLAGDVTITVAGGNITGSIYARGQLDGDTVASAEVIFTGSDGCDCGVFGYSYVGGTASDATLSFTGYTGEFSGAIGGFNGITLDGATAMTLATAAADVSNGAWEFDFTDRADALSGTSFLTWNNADFAGDSVTVNFANAEQAAAGWNIATAAFDATTTFDLYIGGSEITSVAYDTAIAEGDWAGWKFTDENGTLKFKQLA